MPPDPPAADRDALVRVLEKCWSNREGVAASGREHCAAFADALLSSGVLVDAADVRARVVEDLANRVLMDFRDKSRRSQVMRRRGNEWAQGVEDAANIVRGAAQGKPAYFYEQDAQRDATDRAVSEREGTT